MTYKWHGAAFQAMLADSNSDKAHSLEEHQCLYFVSLDCLYTCVYRDASASNLTAFQL